MSLDVTLSRKIQSSTLVLAIIHFLMHNINRMITQGGAKRRQEKSPQSAVLSHKLMLIFSYCYNWYTSMNKTYLVSWLESFSAIVLPIRNNRSAGQHYFYIYYTVYVRLPWTSFFPLSALYWRINEETLLRGTIYNKLANYEIKKERTMNSLKDFDLQMSA